MQSFNPTLINLKLKRLSEKSVMQFSKINLDFIPTLINLKLKRLSERSGMKSANS